MAVTVNDRDALVSSAPVRIVQSTANGLDATFSAERFVVDNGVATPSTITITAVKLGQLYGTPTFSVVSGAASIDTSVPGQCTLSYSNLTADTAKIRISLVFFGTTYTKDCIIEGKVTKPGQVSAVTTTPEFTKVRFTWNKNAELDVKGYEVRTTDSGWGTEGYLYRGSNTSCLIDPGPLDVATTWYIRAFDSSNLYSTSARSVSYTLARPATVTGLAYSFASSSLTASTCTITWTPTTVAHGLKHYRVLFTPPGAAVIDTVVSNPFLEVPGNWINTATAIVYAVDLLGNESLASTALDVIKELPVAPTPITITPTGTSLDLDWPDVAKTSLPVVGYEVRKNNGTWGIKDSNLVWRGSASRMTFNSPVLGANTFYVNSFDSDGRYATSGTTGTYTVQAPGNATGVISTFFDTSTTSATVEVRWNAPVVTSFAPAKYKVVITKPSLPDETIYVDSTRVAFAANWLGDATVTIYTIDTLGLESSGTTPLTISKAVPNPPTGLSCVASGKNLVLSWIAPAKTTLPIYQYEVRTGGSYDTGSLVWKGSATSCTISSFGLGTNNFYVKTIDTENQASTTAASIAFNVTAPLSVGTITYTYGAGSATNLMATMDWAKPSSLFDLDYYEIGITKPSASQYIVKGATDEYSMLIDWTADTTFTVRAFDVAGFAGPLSTVTLPKAPPGQPPIVDVVYGIKSITFDWEDSAQGSLPIAGYELRADDVNWGSPGFEWRGTSSKVEIFNTGAGAKTWYLRAFDTAKQWSTTRTISFTVSAPSAVVNFDAKYHDTSITGATVTFTWAPIPGTFAIEYYSISITKPGGINPISANISANTFTTVADWVGDATVSVRAYDYAGNPGALITPTVTKAAPPQPGVFLTPKIVGSSINLDWPDTTKSTNGLPIAGYELRNTDVTNEWGSGGHVWKGSASSTLVDLTGTVAGTTKTWYLKAYDTDGVYSTTARSYSYTVAAPINTSAVSVVFEDTILTSATATVSWKDTTPLFGLKHYQVDATLTMTATTTAGSSTVAVGSNKGIHIGDIVVSSNIPAGRTVTAVNSNGTQITINDGAGVTAGSVSTTFTTRTYSNSTVLTVAADWLGDRNFTVKTVDLLNNASTGVSQTGTKVVPNPATNFRAQVIDNTVLLYWNLPAPTTLPIAHVLIRKGPVWATAENIGEKAGTFTTITELIGASYTYWIAVVDTDNNMSTPVSLAATVSQPPDYIFNAEWVSGFTGTKSNAIIESNTGHLLLPVNTTETFSTHFTTPDPDWATIQAQIDAGYPIYAQPGSSSGYYEEVFDYGQILGASQASVALSGTAVSGNPSISITISTSTDNISYPNVFSNTNSAFASNFRYVKVRVTATQNVPGDLYKITAMTVRLDAKQKTDSGTATLVAGGAHPQGSITSDYYTLWVPGALPVSGYTLNGTASENSIVSGAGPGGLSEPLWACIDADATSDGDGGFITTSVAAGMTVGHLYAVFVKTTTNNGATYLGPLNNSTINSLAGVPQSNPYFLNGIDLPSLNTWYLMVGYVYPIGYAGADDGISGIYDLTGVKQVSGTSFEYSGGTTVAQRCYHFYNVGNTGQVVQYMARPVIIECTAADAPSKIQYLLTCATDFGAAVTPNNNFIDIVSITTTPTGLVAQTSVVDFLDIPSPKRFNVFNYDNAGDLKAGTVSWTVRGY